MRRGESLRLFETAGHFPGRVLVNGQQHNVAARGAAIHDSAANNFYGGGVGKAHGKVFLAYLFACGAKGLVAFHELGALGARRAVEDEIETRRRRLGGIASDLSGPALSDPASRCATRSTRPSLTRSPCPSRFPPGYLRRRQARTGVSALHDPGASANPAPHSGCRLRLPLGHTCDELFRAGPAFRIPVQAVRDGSGLA